MRGRPNVSAAALGAAMAILSGCAHGTDDLARSPLTVTPLVRVTTYRATPTPVTPGPPPPPPPAVPNPGKVAAYFAEIAFGSEYGQSDPLIHKWTRDPTIAVLGEPCPDDISALRAVLADLNEIIAPVHVTLVESDADITVHFAPEGDFSDLDADYVPGNNGFFMLRWDQSRSLTAGRVLISTTISDHRLRQHVIREEVTQAMGLARDSYTYPNSIFYQGSSRTTQYSELDRKVIANLYRPDIAPGMTTEQASAVLAVGN